MGIWDFIGDADNQRTLAWLGGGLVVVVSGLWAALTKLRNPPVLPPSRPANAIHAGDGIAAVGNVRVDGNLSITKSQIPKAAYALAALGLLVIGWGFTLAGDTCLSGSVLTGGDVTDSNITVTSQSASVDC